MTPECDAIFFGYGALSEEETKAMYTLFNSIAVRMMAMICIKGFSRLITVPYAYRFPPSNNYDLVVMRLLYLFIIINY